MTAHGHHAVDACDAISVPAILLRETKCNMNTLRVALNPIHPNTPIVYDHHAVPVDTDIWILLMLKNKCSKVNAKKNAQK